MIVMNTGDHDDDELQLWWWRSWWAPTGDDNNDDEYLYYLQGPQAREPSARPARTHRHHRLWFRQGDLDSAFFGSWWQTILKSGDHWQNVDPLWDSRVPRPRDHSVQGADLYYAKPRISHNLEHILTSSLEKCICWWSRFITTEKSLVDLFAQRRPVSCNTWLIS